METQWKGPLKKRSECATLSLRCSGDMFDWFTGRKSVASASHACHTVRQVACLAADSTWWALDLTTVDSDWEREASQNELVDLVLPSSYISFLAPDMSSRRCIPPELSTQRLLQSCTKGPVGPPRERGSWFTLSPLLAVHTRRKIVFVSLTSPWAIHWHNAALRISKHHALTSLVFQALTCDWGPGTGLGYDSQRCDT